MTYDADRWRSRPPRWRRCGPGWPAPWRPPAVPWTASPRCPSRAPFPPATSRSCGGWDAGRSRVQRSKEASAKIAGLLDRLRRMRRARRTGQYWLAGFSVTAPNTLGMGGYGPPGVIRRLAALGGRQPRRRWRKAVAAGCCGCSPRSTGRRHRERGEWTSATLARWTGCARVAESEALELAGPDGGGSAVGADPDAAFRRSGCRTPGIRVAHPGATQPSAGMSGDLKLRCDTDRPVCVGTALMGTGP